MEKTLPPLTPYGLILTVDGYGAPQEICADIARLYKLLESMPAHIGMRALGFPHIVAVHEEGIKGLSGFTFIMESHISIHTYEERGFITADIYSCKQFDTEAATKYIAQVFEVESLESNIVVRGKRFNE